jgi:thioredoxin-like negative regulator of GroEL
VADEAPPQVLFIKVDVDENPELAQSWEVQGIPAMVRIEHGEETARLIGYRPESDIKQFAYAPS